MQTSLVSAKARVMTALAMFAFLVPSPSPATATTRGHEPMSRRMLLRMAREEAANVNLQGVILTAIGSIFLVVSLVIGLIMFPILTSTTAEITADDNTTSRDARLIGLLPTIFIVVLLLTGIGFLVAGIRSFKSGS